MGLQKWSEKDIYIPLDKERKNLWTERQRNLGFGIISKVTK